MDPETLRGLHAKYVEMRALREAHLQDDEPDPRDRMRALARRYPGALRELDELPLPTIEDRIAALDAAIAGRAAVPDWAMILGRYHGWMRVALALKRALGRRRELERARAWIRAHRPAVDEPSTAELEACAAAILRPPDGRLSRFVLARIAQELDRPAEELERAAFPPSPMRAAR